MKIFFSTFQQLSPFTFSYSEVKLIYGIFFPWNTTIEILSLYDNHLLACLVPPLGCELHKTISGVLISFIFVLQYFIK